MWEIFYGNHKIQQIFELYHNIPYFHLPIVDGLDEDNNYTLTGLFDLGGCSNMVSQQQHKAATDKFSKLIAEYTNLEGT